jgi:reactive chlorine resistance protein C
MPSMDTVTSRSRTTSIDARIARAEDVGVGVLRYGVVFLLVAIGAAKYFAFEAEGIRPLVENSPFLSWMLGAFGVRGAASIIGTMEIAIGLAIASRPLAPAVSAAGSALGVVTFLTTLSFLFSTPGALSLKHPAAAFLLKDIVLLGACITTAAEALRAARARAAARGEGHVHEMPMTHAAS